MGNGKLKVIISGGGTGGHIFPALSIAGRLREVNPGTEILFVGAEGRMEMEKVPAAGYDIVGLKVAGLQRRLCVGNLTAPFKVMGSLAAAGKIIREFRPDVVVGVGGYASAPVLWKACGMHIPTLIQEQNGFAGLTNRILSERVDRICVAYEGMERFFPKDRIVITGNPIRSNIHRFTAADKLEGVRHFGLDGNRRHLLILGGSLGSRTINEAVKKWISEGMPGGEGIDVMWQCGKFYKSGVADFMEGRVVEGVHWNDFISRMDLAYAAADLVISRSGASSISEICAAAKASVFVPSPNVTEDHQTHNAMALVNRGAAKIVRDADAAQEMMAVATSLVRNGEEIRRMEENAGAMALPDAAAKIVDEIYKIV